MKKLLLFLLLPLFVTSCYAEEIPDKLGELSGAWQVMDDLPDEALEISGELRLDGGYDTRGVLERLWEKAWDFGKEQALLSLRTAGDMILLSLLCALAESFCSAGEMRETIDRIGCCSVTIFASGNLVEMLTYASDTVNRLSDCSHILLPALFSTAAAGGAVLSASARFAASCLSMDVFITASQRLILPLIYMYFSLSISHSLYENVILQSTIKMCRSLASAAMTVLAMAFGAYLSLTGLIAGSKDTLTVKAARTVLSRSLPVVGALLSDSASVLLAAASLVKNSLGVFAMISVCALCIGPVAAFSVRLLIYKAAAAAVDFLPGARLPKLIASIASVFAMLLGLIGCCAAILFIAIVSGIKTVSPL